MANENLAFLLIGIAAVTLGATAVFLLVRRELAAAAGVAGRGRLFLAAALGMGVVAFTVKLTAFTVMSTLPGHTIAPLMVERHFAEILPASWTSMPAVVRAEAPYRWQALPLVAPAPADNPTTPEKVLLGKRLFFDPNLSLTRDVACASCHDVAGRAGVDGRRTSTGIRGQVGGRNAPTVWNAAFQAVLFWDGRAASLEEQAKGPPLNPIEMGMPNGEAVARRVQEDAAYPPLFDAAFGPGTAISFDRVAQAIAAYERTLITPESPYDRFVRGDRNALTPAQLRGMALFQSTGCVTCHTGANFSAASFADPAAGNRGGDNIVDNGRLRMFPGSVTPYVQRYKLTADTGAAGAGAQQGVWRVPSLRNVALTGPYFHNGAVDSLEEAVRIMASSQLGAAVGSEPHQGRAVFWSPGERQVSKVDRPVLSEADVADIAAFLRSLTGDALTAGRAGSRPAPPVPLAGR